MFQFKFSVGDWSDDGHGKCEYYVVESNKDIEAVRAARIKAGNELGLGMDPEDFCSDYEDSRVSHDVVVRAKEAGFDFYEQEVYTDDDDDPDTDIFINPDAYAAYVVWFIAQGDPELKLKIIEEKQMPTLHMGGYGLFH